MDSDKNDNPVRPKSKIVAFYAINISLIVFLFVVIFLETGSEHASGNISLPPNISSTNFIYLGFLAMLFGLRHAVDADHIAAIDTSTRKLMSEGKNSEFTGFYFSLGHSTIVIALSVMLMLSTRYVIQRVSSLETVGSVIGPLVSAVFLFIMAGINIAILLGLRALFRSRARTGSIDLNEMMAGMGIFNRIFRGLFKSVKTQRFLYPIGLLFGLGFDTASEVLILSISAVLAGVFLNLPIYILLIFPALFTLGMTLVDTTDGYGMNRAFGWAAGDPAKKIWYNITLTSISVVFAVTAALLELISVLATHTILSGYPWNMFTTVTNNYWEVLGLIMGSAFAVVIGTSYLNYRKNFGKASAD